MRKHEKQSSRVFLLVVLLVAVFFLGSSVLLARLLTSDEAAVKRAQTHVVTLLKPPPPPPPEKEKPPEPEPPREIKQEEVVTPAAQKDRPVDNRNQDQDDKPAGKHLGLDADGGAGSDAFGLVGNRGGSALIGGGGNGAGLLRKYAGYTRILEDEINRRVRKLYEEKWGPPHEKHQVVVKITLDGRGAVTEVRIVSPSGDVKLDGAVKEALAGTHLSQPPPEGMPKGLSIRLSSKG